MNELNTKIFEEEKLKNSQIVYAKHFHKNTINELKSIILSNFNKDTNYYIDMDIENYRELVRETQDLINSKDFVKKIISNILNEIKEFLGEKNFLMQTNLYLRASRPAIKEKSENIGWHRENFYGSNMEKSVNIWTPILNVNNNNTLRYIPQSQIIHDDKIQIEQHNDNFTKQGTDGHKIGFLYSPKKIVGGVNLNNSSAMSVPDFSSSIFPGNLIHGAAENYSSKIRFSVDFRIIANSNFDESKSKKFHFSSGKPYFENYKD